MKRVLAIWFAVSLVIYMIFGVTFTSQAYLQRLANFPDIMPIFTGLINGFKAIGDAFAALTTGGDALAVIVSIFVALFNLIKLPIQLIGYIIDVIMTILPIGVGV